MLVVSYSENVDDDRGGKFQWLTKGRAANLKWSSTEYRCKGFIDYSSFTASTSIIKHNKTLKKTHWKNELGPRKHPGKGLKFLWNCRRKTTTHVKEEERGIKAFLINHLKNEIIVRIYKAEETLMCRLERKRWHTVARHFSSSNKNVWWWGA